MKKFYKVVARVGNELRSVTLSNKSEKHVAVIYKLNTTVYPTISGSRLFVFDNLYAARNFASGYCNSEVYECDAENPIQAVYKPQDSLEYTSNMLVRFASRWTLFNYFRGVHKKATIPMSVPVGTYLVTCVKLLKKV